MQRPWQPIGWRPDGGPKKLRSIAMLDFVASVNMPAYFLSADSVTQKKLGRIEIAKQALNFSAAHFTIFSQTEREDLHGHNFRWNVNLLHRLTKMV